MKILMINVVCGVGSTGRICTDLAKEYDAQGNTVKIAYGRGTVPEEAQKYAIRINSEVGVKLDGLETRFLDNAGFNSKRQTERFIKWVKEYNPDLIWLHNIHGYYINIEVLFGYLKTCGKEIRWTLHDCWAFTGHCPYFSYVKCNKWKAKCNHCPQIKRYPKSIILDRSSQNWERKKALFTGIPNVHLITPTHWLAELVKQSFLKEYPIEIIYNKIDETVFKPTPSNLREEWNMQGKHIILGVASNWDKRKGLDVFLKLSQTLDDTFAIVLVGLNDKQIKKMPSNLKCIKRTNDPVSLAKIYTVADLFINPSTEETFGLTTLEALSCGTKALVYKGTACEEVANLYGGISVDTGFESIENEVHNILEGKQAE